MPRRTALAVGGDSGFTVGGFLFRATGVEPEGRPSWSGFEIATEFAKHAQRASGWWLADLLRYGESRQEWAECLSQAVDATGLNAKTLANVRAIGAIPRSRRHPDVDFSTHDAVTGLSAEEQTEWLSRAAGERWTRAELRHAIKARRRRMITEGRADTMHSVEVTVLVEVEAQDAYRAEEQARATVMKSISDIPHARVILAHAKPR